jgi:hypothetical protein
VRYSMLSEYSRPSHERAQKGYQTLQCVRIPLQQLVCTALLDLLAETVEVNQALEAEVLGLVAWVVKELDPQALVVLERRDLEVLEDLVLVQVVYLAPVSLGAVLTEVWGWV